jgi:hypothetical protein
LLCLGGARILGRVDTARRPADVADDAEPDPLVFAVDRGNGEVFAFFSYAEATQSISIYSIEENEFVFYADDGTLLQATVVDDRTTFARTDADARTELMGHVRRFAREKSLVVHEPDEPAAYAVPISDWQWLELWPRWMRGLGRMVNRVRR